MISYRNPMSGPRIVTRSHRAPWVSVVLRIIWMFAGLGLVAVMDVAVATVLPIGRIAPFVGLLVIVALAMLMRGSRRKQAMVGLSYIDQAVRQNLPLPTMLAAAERTETG